MTLKDRVANLELVWNAISGLVSIVVLFIGWVIVAPPTLWREAGQIPLFSYFVVTIVTAAIVAGREPKQRTTFWYIVPAGFVATFIYIILSAQLSCPFAGNRMSIGWAYQDRALNYIAKYPEEGCSLLIGAFTGDTEKIWPRSQILISWLLVSVTYMLAVTLLTTIIVRVMRHLQDK